MEPGTEHDDLRRIAPMLADLPRHDPFVVPAGFFDQFPHRVQARAVTPTRPKAGAWLRRGAIAVPAMALVLVALRLFLTAPLSPPHQPLADGQFIDALAEDMDTYEILETAPGDAWPELGQVTVQLTPEEALDYVETHQIDLNEYLY